MITGIFDTHAHYSDEQFNEDRAQTLSFLKENGVSGIIECGCDYRSSLSAVRLSEEYDFIFAAGGIHPETPPETIDEELEKIRHLYENSKVVAVGEIGLDYHYDFTPKEKQLAIFEKQLILSKELDLPVIIHDREAHEDTMKLVSKYAPKGVFHCYSGSVEMAKEILKLGMYIGLGGAVTFKNAKKAVKVAQYLPTERLLLETDCPYMAPVPNRGKRCNSAMIAHTAQFIAELKNMQAQELVDTCFQNAKTLFHI